MELSDSFFIWCGHVGVFSYVGSYAALQLGIIRGNSLTYTFANLLGASLVLVSLINTFNLASAMIQITWIAISIFGLTRLYFLRRQLRFSDEDRAFLETTFPTMSKLLGRSFLNAGSWVDTQGGFVLTEEGQPVKNLYYVSSGEVGVVSGGMLVGTVHNGLIGEMNVLSGGDASATAKTMVTSRLFVISRERLMKLSQNDSDFRIALENGLAGDTGRKLAAANELLSTLSSART